jgi:hypothetical protein
MSIPMEKSLKNLEKIIEKTRDESQKTRLEEVVKIISKNRKKIWLRTKTGKPYAEKALIITEKLVSQFESKPMEVILNELENHVVAIQEESSRRNMVVT